MVWLQNFRVTTLVVIVVLSLSTLVACSSDSAHKNDPTVQTRAGSSADVLPPTPTPTPPANEFAIIGQPEKFMLDDLSLVGIVDWVNSEPLTIEQLCSENKLVLLDFWTYTCVNCVRTFPYLKAWHDAYKDYGFETIGVHSPEFEFEQITDNVRVAVERYGIEYPVAVDSDKATWEKYGNHFWPSKYLISVGPTGESTVMLRHFGEGGYQEIENTILAELDRLGYNVDQLPPVIIEGPVRSETAHTVTRALYGGYSKNYLSDGLYAGQDAYYEVPDRTFNYADDGTRRRGQFYLEGRWKNGSSAVTTASQPVESSNASFRFDFWATSVNSVLSSVGEEVVVTVELNGKPLPVGSEGEDIERDSDGNSTVIVGEARLYQLVQLPDFGNHELTLKTNSEGLSVYTATFGANEFGP